jgi:DNA-binding cell septation regulator SpoVG
MKNVVTETQLIPIKHKDGLIGFGSVVLNNSLYLGSIGIHKKLNDDSYRITYPTRKVSNRNLNIYHPINIETSKTIEDALIAKAKKLFD